MLFGVDISHHNSAAGDLFPFDRAAADGAAFVIAKASQGFCPPGVAERPYNFKDDDFDRHRKGAREAGLVFGAYHWLMRPSAHTGTGPEQAEFFVRSLARGTDGTIEQGRQAADGLLLAVDVERTAFGTGPEAREIDGLPGWGVLRRFIRRFQQLLPGHPLLVYGNAGSGAALTDNDVAALGDTHLWYAAWTGFDGRLSAVDAASIRTWRPGLGGFDGATMVQFSSDGNVGGRPRVDLDAFRGTREELLALTRPAVGVPPVPDPERKERRRRFREGYGAMLDAAHTAAQIVTLPAAAVPADPRLAEAYHAGVAAARADLLEHLDRRLALDPDEGP